MEYLDDAGPVGFIHETLDRDGVLRLAAEQMAVVMTGDTSNAQKYADLLRMVINYSDSASQALHEYLTVELPAHWRAMQPYLESVADELDPKWRTKAAYSQKLQKARLNLRHKVRKCKQQRKRKGLQP